MILGAKRPFRWPDLPPSAFAVAAAISFVFALLYLLISEVGLYGASMGVDWAHHMAVIDIIARGGRPSDHPAQLWEFANYPRFSYWPAVWLSDDFGISTLQAYQIIAMFAAIVGLVMTALIIVNAVGFRSRASLFGLISGGVGLYVLSDLGFSHVGMTAYNGFYSQSVATAIALIFYGLMHILASNDRLWSLTISVPLMSALTAAFHLTPALWLAAAGLVLVVSCHAPLFKTVIAAIVVSALGGTLMYYAPGTAMTLEVAGVSNGAGAFNGRGIPINHRLDILVVAYVALLAAAAGLAALVWRRGSFEALQHDYLRSQAGTVGVLGIGTILFADIALSDPVGYYSVAKYASLFVAFFAVVIGVLAREAYSFVRGTDTFREAPFRPGTSSLVASIFVLVYSLSQGIELPSHAQDQSRLVAIQNTPSYEFPYWNTRTPALPSANQFATEEEYYIAISILGYPRELVTSIIPDGGVDEIPYGPAIIHPARLTGALDMWQGQRLHMSSPTVDRYFLTRFAQRGVEEWGRWILGRRIEFLGQLPPAFGGRGVCVEAIAAPSAEAPHVERLVASFDAGGGLQTVTFDEETRNATVFVPLSDPMPPSGEFVLAIENVENSLGPVQFGSPEIGVGLVSMWVAQSDCG